MEFDRAQLKRNVRLSMKGTASRPMLVTLLFGFVVGIGTWLLNAILGGLLTGGVSGLSETALYYVQQGYDMEEAMNIAMLELLRQGPGAIFGAVVGGAVLSIFIALWQSAMNVGYEGYCLSMVRNENPPMGKIFGALPQFGPVLVTRLLTELFLFLWTLLVVLGYAVLLFAAMMAAVAAESAFLTVILVLVAVVCLVLGIIWVSMRYVLVDYVLLDKGLSGLEAIRENKRLMKGNIGRAFVLQLSFIGWYLLEGVVVWAGVIFAVLPIIAAAGGIMDTVMIGTGSMGGLLAASGFALLILAAVAIGAVVLNLWLKPYVTGAMAGFYDWANGRPELLSGGPNFQGGWGGHQDYTWNAGPSSGTGTGSGPRNDIPAPKPPKPKDDPWN